jgi:hypothetical protein
MKYAELKADNERLRTQLADLVNAVETLREPLRLWDMYHETNVAAYQGMKLAEAVRAILDSRKAR